jgi:hypothetical protein
MKRATVAQSLRVVAREMLAELEANYLHVAKVPIPNGYKRVVVSFNAWWYRDFCGDWLRDRGGRYRKPRTMIRRQHTIRAMKEIISGYCVTEYAKRLLPKVIKHAMEGRHDKNATRKTTARKRLHA